MGQLTKIRLYYNRLRRQLFSRVGLTRLLFIVLIILSAIGFFWFLRNRSPLSSTLKNLSTSSLAQHQGRTNILVMGRGGDGHEAPDLTDTIIFISLSHSGSSPLILSIPRDVWVPSLKAKINSAFHFGLERQSTPAGILLAKSAVSEIINQPVHYAVIIDFSTFVKALDLIGGLDINVDRTFDDFRYPIPGRESDPCGGDPETKCRYEHLRFEVGLRHMDGATALKYVRSRNSLDPEEGNDYARSRRQGKVISTAKAKLLSRDLLKQPVLYRQLYDLFAATTFTDIPSDLYFPLARLATRAKDEPVRSASLAEPDQLYHPPLSPLYQNQWVLVPKDNNAQLVFEYVSGLLEDDTN